MNIDKDINYLKRQIETSERQFEEIGVGCLSSKEIEAISNVISELDETKATLKCTQDSWYKDTQELETWKKIAEKLESMCESYGLDVDIDWARKEVENENNK